MFSLRWELNFYIIPMNSKFRTGRAMARTVSRLSPGGQIRSVSPYQICGLRQRNLDRFVPSTSVFLSRYHSTTCSVLIFIYELLSLEGQMEQAWEPSIIRCFLKMGNIERNYHNFFHELRRVKRLLKEEMLTVSTQTERTRKL